MNVHCPHATPLHRPARSRHGFSLVELLVVIGIIVVLVSILMPTLAGVRQSAWAVTCQSNERQLMSAFLQFAIDHDESLPGNYFDNHQPEPWQRDWLLGDDPNQGQASEVFSGPQAGTIFRYVHDPKVYLCPAYQPSFLNAGAGSNGRYDYAAFLDFTGARVQNVKLEGRFKNPNGTWDDVYTPIICEEEPKHGINGGNDEGGHSNFDALGHYHRGGGHYAAIDGSVHWYKEPAGCSAWNWYSIAPRGALKWLGPYTDPVTNQTVTWGFWNRQ